MSETQIGRIDSYFARIGVAGITLTGALRVGDQISIKGHSTDFTQTVDSMQIEHEEVQQAGPGASVGVKVSDRCRVGDLVFRITA